MVSIVHTFNIFLVSGLSYFSSHYHLGHRKFETGDPEVFLFGELNDINFLNSKPVAVSLRERERGGGGGEGGDLL